MRFSKHEMHVGIIFLFLQWLYLLVLLLRDNSSSGGITVEIHEISIELKESFKEQQG